MRSPSNPLDPAELEQWMVESSGLMKVRPPLTPSQSGDSFYHAIPFQILSWRPRLVVYPAFVDSDRCDHIVELAKKYLYPSGLAFAPGEKVDVNQQTRTSKGTFLSAEMDPDGDIAWVEERIAAVTLLPRENGEPFNVLKYENGQHYDSHMDSFDPKTFGPQRSQLRSSILLMWKREGKWCSRGRVWGVNRGPLMTGGTVMTVWGSSTSQGKAMLFCFGTFFLMASLIHRVCTGAAL